MQVLEKLGRGVCLPALLPRAEAKRLAADAGTRVNNVGSSKFVFHGAGSFGRTFEARKEWKEIQYNGWVLKLRYMCQDYAIMSSVLIL